MYTIVNTVFGNNYYWNQRKEKWEGLINNATQFDRDTFDFKFKSLKRQFGMEIVSYILNGKHFPCL